MNPSLQGYLVGASESLAAAGELGLAADQLSGVGELVTLSTELSLALGDAAIPAAARRAVLEDLLEGHVLPEVRKVVLKAIAVEHASEAVPTIHAAAREMAGVARRDSDVAAVESDEVILGRQASRHRVAGYAAWVFEACTHEELEEVEDELFRFARVVESNRALRSALGDRDLPVSLRQGLVEDLLVSKASPPSVRLARYVVRGGRARDVVATLDSVVDEAARARGWRIAHVRAASEVGDGQRRSLAQELGVLAGNPVDLQVTIDSSLLGGLVVQVGDLLVDGSARHRLDQLKEHLLVSEAAYRVPEGREDT